MKNRSLKIVGFLLLTLLGIGFWPHAARAQFTVHDPIHTAMNAGNWLTQLERMQQQIDSFRRRIQQWDEDFTKLWGKTSGQIHEVLRTPEQILYAGSRPWHDLLATREEMYNALNQITRTPGAGFGEVKAVRDAFYTIRADLDRYRYVSGGVKDYYRSLGNLSAEGLYVSARSYEAGQKVWKDAQKLNEYARDTSPVGAAKTQAFAASVALHAQGYQLEAFNRLLRQLAYLNMKQENDQRAALQAAAGMQEALTETYRTLPVKVHVMD